MEAWVLSISEAEAHNYYFIVSSLSILEFLLMLLGFLSSILHVFWFLIFSIFLLISSCKLLFKLANKA